MDKKTIGGLSPLMVEMLAYLRRYIEANVYAPSYSEIGKALDYTSKSGIARVMAQLEDRGLIKRVAGKMRAIEITSAGMNTRLPAP